MTKYAVQSLLSGKKAIIADSDDQFSDFLSSLLKEAGVDSVVTDKGDHAWNMIQTNSYDLVLINVCLEGMLGIEIVDRIRSLPNINGLKVVLIGAIHRAYRYHAAPTELYGADAYIENLISAGDFYKVLKRLFTISDSEQENILDIPEEPAQIKAAKGLARKILSDIIASDITKAERGIRNGNFYEIYEEELIKGKTHYDNQVSEDISKEEDYFYAVVNDYIRSKRNEILHKQDIAE